MSAAPVLASTGSHIAATSSASTPVKAIAQITNPLSETSYSLDGKVVKIDDLNIGQLWNLLTVQTDSVCKQMVFTQARECCITLS
jgi:hypothetical protein